MGSMVGAMQPAIREAAMQMNQHAFNQQLGRGASNQMYEPSPGQYDPYTASRRPNYMPFGPNQQFYQPIYRPSYDQQVRTMDQMPQPMMPQPMPQQPMQQQYTPAPTQQANPVVRRIFKGNFSRAFGGQEPSNFPYSVNYGASMTPQPMQSQYRPIPIASQTTIDQLMSQARSEGAAEAAANQAAQYSGGAKAGGKVHGEGIDSLLRK